MLVLGRRPRGARASDNNDEWLQLAYCDGTMVYVSVAALQSGSQKVRLAIDGPGNVRVDRVLVPRGVSPQEQPQRVIREIREIREEPGDHGTWTGTRSVTVVSQAKIKQLDQQITDIERRMAEKIHHREELAKTLGLPPRAGTIRPGGDSGIKLIGPVRVTNSEEREA
jgi:hypothetical protein